MSWPGTAPDVAAVFAPRTLERAATSRAATFVTATVQVALLYVANLNLEGWSILAALALIGWTSLRWCASPTVDSGFALRLGLLVLFAASFFTVTGAYGYYTVDNCAKWFAMIVGMYVLGYAAGLDRPSTQLWKLLALAAGFATFAFLSVKNAIDSTSLLSVPEIVDREAADAWGQGVSVSGTGLGALGSLAMCLLPAAFARRAPGMSALLMAPWRVLVALLAALGFYVNIALQNRTPMIAFAGAVLATGVLLSYLQPSSAGRRLAALAVLVAFVVVALWSSEILEALSPEFGVARRFNERGVGTERYGAWFAVLGSLPQHPFGGRTADLGGLAYAHNVWLDVAVDAGVLAALLLLAFHVTHVGPIRRLLQGDVASPVRLAAIGLCVSFLATLLVEPAVQFSIMYFAASGYVLGGIYGLTRR
jgi:hypothetical protein